MLIGYSLTWRFVVEESAIVFLVSCNTKEIFVKNCLFCHVLITKIDISHEKHFLSQGTDHKILKRQDEENPRNWVRRLQKL
jgi:hypothetical protein